MNTRHVGLLLVMVGLVGCSTTLSHPQSGQTMTCQSGWALGGGTGIAGGVMAGIALLINVFEVAEYQKCVEQFKRAGYEEIPPAPAPSETPADEPQRIQG